MQQSPDAKKPVHSGRVFSLSLSVPSSLGPGFRLYTLNEDPQPQVLFTWGFSNLNPAASSVST